MTNLNKILTAGASYSVSLKPMLFTSKGTLHTPQVKALTNKLTTLLKIRLFKIKQNIQTYYRTDTEKTIK